MAKRKHGEADLLVANLMQRGDIQNSLARIGFNPDGRRVDRWKEEEAIEISVEVAPLQLGKPTARPLFRPGPIKTSAPVTSMASAQPFASQSLQEPLVVSSVMIAIAEREMLGWKRVRDALVKLKAEQDAEARRANGDAKHFKR